MYKISVIIPVYNVEKYIRECIISVLNQSIKDIEIIIVNDGTIDNSIKRIDDLITINRNIKLINKENGGLSSARNEGLKYASGEYIAFIDSDDYISQDFLEILYNEAKYHDLDIAIGNYSKLYENGKVTTKKRANELYTENVIKGDEFLYHQLKLNDYKMEVWDDLYRRAFLIENNIKFYDNLLHEDEEFTPRVLLSAQKVKLVNTDGYMYRQRDNSIMNQKINIKNIDSLKQILDEMIILYNNSDSKLTKKCISRVLNYLTNELISKIKNSNLKNKYELYKSINIKTIKPIIEYDCKLKMRSKLKFTLISNSPQIYERLVF